MAAELKTLGNFKSLDTPLKNLDSILSRLQALKSEINSKCLSIGRDPSKVKILLATKNQDIEILKNLAKNGITLFGENKVQELLLKQSELHNIQWHFIGHLQTNKAKEVIGKVDLVHSLDSLKLASKLNTLLTKSNSKLNVLIQVNTSNEATKYGFKNGEVDSALQFIKEQCPQLIPKGFMTMAPAQEPGKADNTPSVRNCFKQLKALSQEHGLPELSMGMSNDYMVAVEEGATLLRLGSIVFGKRA